MASWNVCHSKEKTSHRVVVTGMGAVSPLGLSVQTTWDQALAGRSGIARTTQFDTLDCPVTISGELKGFDVTQTIPTLYPAPDCPVTQAMSAKNMKRGGRFVHLALVAGLEAYAHSGLDQVRSTIMPDRLGVYLGAGMGGLPEIESVHLEFLEKGYRRVTPFFIPQVIPNLAAGQLSVLLNLKGPNLCSTTACASGAHSIGEAFRQIQRGDVEIMLAGGSEAVICKLGIAGFAAMKALSTRNEVPEQASRPFDQDRDGFVMGEGAAVLVLENFEFAKKRNAVIYGEIVGYGISGDAYHITSPSVDGGQRAMQLALQDARLNPEQISYINAHGTSTPLGDIMEAQAIARIFLNAQRAQGSGGHLNVSSTKSMTGHLLGASGALEAIFSILAIYHGKIPPTINLDRVDSQLAGLGLDFTPKVAVDKTVQYALSNSFGFGGTNASLVMGKV